MKKKLIILIIIIFLPLIGGGVYYYIANQKYTYEWVEVKNSAIGQQKLYINDSFGNHINGTARLIHINGKSKKVEVSKEGLLYVKSIVEEVRNPRKK